MSEHEQQDAETGRLLLMALFVVIRRMRAQGPGEPVDLPSLYVLQTVLTSPGIRVSEVAGSIGLDSSTVSRHINNLEKVGYIVREADPRDKRATCLRLTEEGSAVLSAAFQMRASMIMDALKDWSAEDRRRLLEMALRFTADLGRIAPD